jgi:hypothetical protein
MFMYRKPVRWTYGTVGAHTLAAFAHGLTPCMHRTIGDRLGVIAPVAIAEVHSTVRSQGAVRGERDGGEPVRPNRGDEIGHRARAEMEGFVQADYIEVSLG